MDIPAAVQQFTFPLSIGPLFAARLPWSILPFILIVADQAERAGGLVVERAPAQQRVFVAMRDPHLARPHGEFSKNFFRTAHAQAAAPQQTAGASETAMAGSSSPYEAASPNVKNVSQRTPEGSSTQALFDCA